MVDLQSEGKPISSSLLEYIHYSKTGALLRACVRCGALAAGAATAELRALTEFGNKIGLVFQIVDDILDVTSSSEILGKAADKDARVEKATSPAFYGIEASREKARIGSFGSRAYLRLRRKGGLPSQPRTVYCEPDRLSR